MIECEKYLEKGKEYKHKREGEINERKKNGRSMGR